MAMNKKKRLGDYLGWLHSDSKVYYTEPELHLTKAMVIAGKGSLSISLKSEGHSCIKASFLAPTAQYYFDSYK